MLIAATTCSGARDEVGQEIINSGMPDQAAIEVFSALIPPSTTELTAVGCLSIQDKDAPKTVIDALLERRRHVLPASRCHLATGKPSDKQEVAYSLAGFKRHGDTAAEVEGTSYAGAMAASCTLFDLALIAGKWRISRQDLLWISLHRLSQGGRNNAEKIDSAQLLS